ncbi:MAG: acylphosphatase [Candidatus Nanoarchaeia archaeon]
MSGLKIRVTGKVQGVFFRDYTKKKAVQLGIKGTVKNKEDGSVEIIADENENIQKFIDWCWEGSPASRVDNVEISQIELPEKFNSFEVLL